MPHSPRFSLTTHEIQTLSAALSLLTSQLDARTASTPTPNSKLRQTLSDTLALHAKLLAPTLTTPASDVPTSSLPVSEDLSNTYRSPLPTTPPSNKTTVITPPPAQRELDNPTEPSRDEGPTFLEEMAMRALMRLSNEDRLSIIKEFCFSCGCDDPRCQCGNDE